MNAYLIASFFSVVILLPIARSLPEEQKVMDNTDFFKGDVGVPLELQSRLTRERLSPSPVDFPEEMILGIKVNENIFITVDEDMRRQDGNFAGYDYCILKRENGEWKPKAYVQAMRLRLTDFRQIDNETLELKFNYFTNNKDDTHHLSIRLDSKEIVCRYLFGSVDLSESD